MHKFCRVSSIVLAAMVTAASPAPLIGVWSGDRATLTLTATGGTFVEDCAEATIGAAVRSDARGHFSAVARREIYTGGPQPADVPPALAATRFAGQITPDGMLLEVGSGTGMQKFRLVPGRRVKHIRCM